VLEPAPDAARRIDGVVRRQTAAQTRRHSEDRGDYLSTTVSATMRAVGVREYCFQVQLEHA